MAEGLEHGPKVYPLNVGEDQNKGAEPGIFSSHSLAL